MRDALLSPSPHEPSDPAGADARHHAAISLIAREENEADAPDQILKGNISDLGGAAVDRIVPVVAQHKEMPVRNRENIGVVEKTMISAIERLIACPIGHRLPPAFGIATHVRAASAVALHVGQTRALERRVVDVKLALFHLNAIAGQTDHALD